MKYSYNLDAVEQRSAAPSMTDWVCLQTLRIQTFGVVSLIQAFGFSVQEGQRSDLWVCSQINFHQIRAHKCTQQEHRPPHACVPVCIYDAERVWAQEASLMHFTRTHTNKWFSPFSCGCLDLWCLWVPPWCGGLLSHSWLSAATVWVLRCSLVWDICWC